MGVAQIYYVVDTAPDDKWEGGVGHVTVDTVKEQLPQPSNDHLILVCGPPPMMKVTFRHRPPSPLMNTTYI